MFRSRFEAREHVSFPLFSELRVMMMPVVIGEIASLPSFVGDKPLYDYFGVISDLFEMSGHDGEVGYITIDARVIETGRSHRRPGPHVDGVYRGGPGGWGGGGIGPWAGNGMLLVSTHAQCRAWAQDLDGEPGPEGECDHLVDQLRDEAAIVLEPQRAYWLDAFCVHESLPCERPTPRQLVRLSLPSTAPWFEGYTVNTRGVKPTGPILPRREFMAA